MVKLFGKNSIVEHDLSILDEERARNKDKNKKEEEESYEKWRELLWRGILNPGNNEGVSSSWNPRALCIN